MSFNSSSILVGKDFKVVLGAEKEVVVCMLDASLHIHLFAHQWVLL